MFNTATFLLIRKDMGANEHHRLSNITLRHKLKEQHFYCFLHFMVYFCLSQVKTLISIEFYHCHFCT